MSKADLILAASQGYQWPEIRNWARSLRASGYTGLAHVLLYDASPELISQLRALDIGVMKPMVNHLGMAPVTARNDRFYHAWQCIDEMEPAKLERVIMTDIKDVVFQSDPSAWLDSNLGNKTIFVVSEGMRYCDEAWNRDNFIGCFGDAIWATDYRLETIYNCGVWGGTAQAAREMFLLIYLIGFGHPLQAAGDWTDQAALNLVTRLGFIEENVRFIASEEGFAAQLGTFLDTANDYGPYLKEPRPVINGGKVYTAGGLEYSIVHQYDRIPELAAAVTERYQ